MRGTGGSRIPGNFVAILGSVDAAVAALRHGYEALNAGDLSVVSALLDPDIVWELGPPSPEAGTHRGRASFERFLSSWRESFDDFRVEPEDVLQHGDDLIAFVRQAGRGRSSGAELTVHIAHVWTVKDGRAIRWRGYANREQALAAVEGGD
jgi:ketosteroid isomerase-like protein